MDSLKGDFQVESAVSDDLTVGLNLDNDSDSPLKSIYGKIKSKYVPPRPHTLCRKAVPNISRLSSFPSRDLIYFSVLPPGSAAATSMPTSPWA